MFLIVSIQSVSFWDRTQTAEGVVAVGVDDGMWWCGGWLGGEGSLAVAVVGGDGGV